MAMRGILLDTNAYAAFKQGQAEAVEIIQRTPFLGINAVILGELLGGFAAGTREQQNRAELGRFLQVDRVRFLAVDQDTASFYALVYQNLKRKGRPIPTNDMWIAATAFQHSLAIFSYDNHFSVIDGIVVGSTPSELSL
jgi:tRNA(fMet)-specific endonuclease VapC